MIGASIDEKELARQLGKMAVVFGESNEACIARWGVATCRELIQSTQAWGDTTKAKKKQEDAILKDANRAMYVISRNAKLVRRINQKAVTGLVIDGELALFTPRRNLVTPEEINDFINLNRTTRKGRVPNLSSQMKGITTAAPFRKAMTIRKKRAGLAKGGWIGAGISIGSKQRKGSRITIGKNVAGYAHKFKSGGTSSIKRSVWHPEGDIINNVAHVSTEHVLKKSDAKAAINDGAKNILSWYRKTMQARLNRRK